MRSKGYSSCLVCLCVCVCVCVPVCTRYSGSTWDKKYNERYHRVKRQICGNIKMYLNCLIRKLERFYFPWQEKPFLVDAYSACNVSYTPRYMFALHVKHCI